MYIDALLSTNSPPIKFLVFPPLALVPFHCEEICSAFARAVWLSALSGGLEAVANDRLRCKWLERGNLAGMLILNKFCTPYVRWTDSEFTTESPYIDPVPGGVARGSAPRQKTYPQMIMRSDSPCHVLDASSSLPVALSGRSPLSSCGTSTSLLAMAPPPIQLFLTTIVSQPAIRQRQGEQLPTTSVLGANLTTSDPQSIFFVSCRSKRSRLLRMTLHLTRMPRSYGGERLH